MAYGTNAPFGLQPRVTLTGATWNGQTNQYPIKSGYATNLFTGDPVVGLADGSIGIGVAGTGITGVFQGCTYRDTTGKYVYSPYWPASTVTYGTTPEDAQAFVCDDPTVLFDIQVSTSANAQNPTAAAADLNNNANFALATGGVLPANPTTGSVITGQSGYYLDISTLDPTATRSLKLLRFTPVPGNVASLPFNNVMVMLNNDIAKGGTGTAGV